MNVSGGTYALRTDPNRIRLYRYDRNPNAFHDANPNVNLDLDYIENLIENETLITKTNPNNADINAFHLAFQENTQPALLQDRAAIIEIIDQVLDAYMQRGIIQSVNSRAYERQVIVTWIQEGKIRFRHSNQLFVGQYIRWLPDVRRNDAFQKWNRTAQMRRCIPIGVQEAIPDGIAVGLPINLALLHLNQQQVDDEGEEAEAEEEEAEDDLQAGGMPPVTRSQYRESMRNTRRRRRQRLNQEFQTRRNDNRVRQREIVLPLRDSVRLDYVRQYNKISKPDEILGNTQLFQNTLADWKSTISRHHVSEEEKNVVRDLFVRLANKLVILAGENIQQAETYKQRAEQLHAFIDNKFNRPFFSIARSKIEELQQQQQHVSPATPLSEHLYPDEEDPGNSPISGISSTQSEFIDPNMPPFPEQFQIQELDDHSFMNIDGYFCNEQGKIRGTRMNEEPAFKSKLLRTGGVITEIKIPDQNHPEMKLLRIKFIGQDKNLFYRTCIISNTHNLLFERTPQLYLNMLDLQQQFMDQN